MPIFQLTEALLFPDPFLAEEGILAVGGDLSPERIILAYQNGIFPWYNEGEPIIWHAPNPRFVLYPEKFKVSKTLKSLINKDVYSIKVNSCFSEVIKNCQQIEREFQVGTWITNEMENAYIKLNELGFAHSIEVFNQKGKLVGGLYGILLGKAFFGESMFHLESNTSKLAFHYLVNYFDLDIIDCQVYTPHLESLGAEDIDLKLFLNQINKAQE